MPDSGSGSLNLDAALTRAFAGRSAMNLGIGLGHESGLLVVLAGGPGSAAEIASRAGTDPRMTEEWLRVMVVAGFADHAQGIFTPADGMAELAGDGGPETPAGAFAALLHRDRIVLPLLSEALHSGAGVEDSAYEPDVSLAQDILMAETIEKHLLTGVLGRVPGVTEQLARGVDVLDVGCGSGRALVVMARAHPDSRYTGYDLSSESLTRARVKAEAAGVDIDFQPRDVLDIPPRSFDIITAIDVVHDLGNPFAALVAAREGLRDGGVLLMCEPAASGDFETDRHSDAAWQYFSSLASCIPRSQAAGGPGLGSLWGRAGALPMLAEAGFDDVIVHDTDAGYAVYACR